MVEGKGKKRAKEIIMREGGEGREEGKGEKVENRVKGEERK